ncbi:MAG: hypothetical protein LH617_11645 [Ramlibacter sp.]|nr:hypothetical protein [Ramlibacter sp.]
MLRLRKTANVKRLIVRLFRREECTDASQANQGWQAIEDELRLSGWSRARRVVVLRRRIRHDIALTGKSGGRNNDQLVLALPNDVQAAIPHVRDAAVQLPKLDRWATLLASICERIVGQLGLPTPPPALTRTG